MHKASSYHRQNNYHLCFSLPSHTEFRTAKAAAQKVKQQKMAISQNQPDYHETEAAEPAASIFPTVSIRTTLTTASLKGACIGVAGSAVLSGFLDRCSSLRELNLSGNELQCQGVEYIANALSSGNSAIEILALNDNDMRSEGARFVAKSLQSVMFAKGGGDWWEHRDDSVCGAGLNFF